MLRCMLSLVGTLVGILTLGVGLHAAPLPETKPSPFDYYLNRTLLKTYSSGNVKQVHSLALDDLPEYDGVLPDTNGTFLIFKTTQGRNAKVLVQSARQKIEGDRLLPVLLIDRYVTYKEGEEQTILTHGAGLKLYPGFRFSLDLGQVVPEEILADLVVIKDGDTVKVKTLNKPPFAIVVKHDKKIEPARAGKVVVADPFEPRYFTGTYKLYDDGRRSGKLVLKVEEDGNVTGAFYSDRDGAKYDLRGRVGTPNHSIQFTVNLPRTEQVFNGWLFTGDGKALVGTSRMLARDAGFYALRIEE